MPRQPYNLEFQPKERRRRDQALRFLGGFCAIVLLLGIVSAIALQRDGLVDQLLGALRPTEAPTEPPEDDWPHTGSALFLLCGTDDKQQNLRFCALARVDITQRKVHIFPLPPRTMAPHGGAAPGEGRERSLEQALRDGGPKELKAAVEALTESAVDRYICSGDSGFVMAMNLVLPKGVSVQVPARINYTGSDFTLTLSEGKLSLHTDDRLLRYFRYLGTLEEGGTLAQGELLARVLETYLDRGDAQQLETLFYSLMNILQADQTDITAKDFVAHKKLLVDILAHGDKFTFDVKD